MGGKKAVEVGSSVKLKDRQKDEKLCLEDRKYQQSPKKTLPKSHDLVIFQVP